MTNAQAVDRETLEGRKRKPLTWRRKLLFFGFTLFFSVVFALLAFLAADSYLHAKHDGALNRRGYRGKIVGGKKADEIRLVVLGGSCAYGYGGSTDTSMPAVLEKELQGRTGRRVSVVNLAFNNHGAYSFLPTLIDYESLDYDGVVLYEGYNDLGGPNKTLTRRDSPLFTTFGYYPVLPLVLNEKLMIWRYGNLENAHREGKVVFRQRVAPKSVKDRQRKIDESIARSVAASPPVRTSGECGDWDFYCDSMDIAVRYALAKKKNVWVVTQPYIGDHHRSQQALMAAMLDRRFDDARLHYVNLGNALNVQDPKIAFDGVHLYPVGNRMIAQRLADVIAPELRK